MSGMTLPSLLLDAGTHHQGRIALVTPGGRLTYGELYLRALRLAAFLVDAGVRPGDRVALCLPKCAELSVAIFGIMLTGGCYVPIDYTAPAARGLIMIQDSEARAVICTYRLGRQLFDITHQTSKDASDRKADRDVLVYILNQTTPTPRTQRPAHVAWPQVMDSTEMISPVPVDPAMRAYILYTSGSTGRPKGVVHTQHSAMTFVRWAAGRTKLVSEDVISQHSSPSFDLTVFDFFCSTMAAATLTSVPEWMFGQLAKTCRFIVENGITVWYSVPSALLRSEGVEAMSGLSRSSLRHVVFAGEVIPKKALKEFVEYLPPRCLVSNWYGPTETNVCTHHDITTVDLESDIPIPIGMPCPYAQIRIEPVVPGQPDQGELLVDSPSNMEGYWKRDHLTADAFTREDHDRQYYKTGDIVTYNGDKLQFLGRKDRQLKIRGYRLQPEEIELTLRGHADIVDVAVVVINENGTELVGAAVVTTTMKKSVLADLKRFCNETLPLYMIPSKIIRVAALPRGARGKIDLQAISKIISSQDESEIIEMI